MTAINHCPNTNSVDLRKLNSLTKYPSILTYHQLGEKGALLPELNVEFTSEDLVATEKVDGTNSRIILMPDGRYLIGSREELLHASGDLIYNPALGIVETLKQTAEALASEVESVAFPKQACSRAWQGESPENLIWTLYFETYGGKTTSAAKQYTSRQAFGFRLFDISAVECKHFDKTPSEISLWRENGGQFFLPETLLESAAGQCGLGLTPRIEITPLPTEIDATYAWLQQSIATTLVALDEDAGGRPEGLVVRTSDRAKIAKIRFEDYARHEKRNRKRG